MTLNQKSCFILYVSLIFFQCGGSIPEIHYYLIDYPVSKKSSKNEPAHRIILGIERFEAMPLYKEERLVYRNSPYEGKYYHYHRWIVSPEEMITNKVIEQLRATDLIEQVVPFPKFSQVDYVLSGTIKALEEWDEEDQWYARVQLAFELIYRQSNQIVWQETIEKRNQVSKKSPVEVVKGINLSVEQCIQDVQKSLDDIFSNYRPE